VVKHRASCPMTGHEVDCFTHLSLDCRSPTKIPTRAPSSPTKAPTSYVAPVYKVGQAATDYCE
jgi:hypothetical protein